MLFRSFPSISVSLGVRVLAEMASVRLSCRLTTSEIMVPFPTPDGPEMTNNWPLIIPFFIKQSIPSFIIKGVILAESSNYDYLLGLFTFK